MSTLFDFFSICSKLDEDTKEKIHLFHVFQEYRVKKSEDETCENILYITESDEVYTFGSNRHGCCGLGHNSVVKERQIIPELRNKKIKQFFIGYNFILSLSENNHVYGWGHNTYGQLGRNFNSEEFLYLKPHIIGLTEDIIVDISCGVQHALVLTSNGNIYGWGDNQYGQVGLGQGSEAFIPKPTRISKFNDIIITIMCSFNRSFALTKEGMVYSWGSNYGCDLGHEINRNSIVSEPKLINISDVISICSSNVNTYFLKSDGHIYFCGQYRKDDNCFQQNRPRKLRSSKIFSSLFSMSNFCKFKSKSIAICDGLIYHLNFDKIEETDESDVIHYFIYKFSICPQTMNLKELSNQRHCISVNEQEPPKKEKFEKRFTPQSVNFSRFVKVNDRKTSELFTVVKYSEGMGLINQYF